MRESWELYYNLFEMFAIVTARGTDTTPLSSLDNFMLNMEKLFEKNKWGDFKVIIDDSMAVDALFAYLEACKIDGCNDYQKNGVRKTIDEFRAFAVNHPGRMKQLGITRGK